MPSDEIGARVKRSLPRVPQRPRDGDLIRHAHPTLLAGALSAKEVWVNRLHRLPQAQPERVRAQEDVVGGVPALMVRRQ